MITVSTSDRANTLDADGRDTTAHDLAVRIMQGADECCALAVDRKSPGGGYVVVVCLPDIADDVATDASSVDTTATMRAIRAAVKSSRGGR